MNIKRSYSGALVLLFTFFTAFSIKAQTISVIDTYSYLMAVDEGGNLYNGRDCQIYKRTSSGTTRIAGTAISGFSGDGGPATLAQTRCEKLTVAGGNVYFIDDYNRIRKINSSGIINTIAGIGTTGFSGDGGPATAAHLFASAIGADASGNVYIAGGARIRKINAAGSISTIAGTGIGGHDGDGGAATIARIDSDIRHIVIDPSGNIYFTCVGYNRVRKVSTSGIITTVAGTGSVAFNGDGIAATAANMGMLYGLATDGAGNLYISAFLNNRIRKVNSAGIITTVAGTGTGTCPIEGDTAATATIWTPEDIGIDGLGNLYFGSGMCNSLYKIPNVGSTLGMGEIKSNPTICIAPTINTGSFTIKGYTSDGRCELTIISLQGQVMLQREMSVPNNHIDEAVILPDNLLNGIYTINVVTGVNKTVSKCVLMR